MIYNNTVNAPTQARQFCSNPCYKCVSDAVRVQPGLVFLYDMRRERSDSGLVHCFELLLRTRFDLQKPAWMPIQNVVLKISHPAADGVLAYIKVEWCYRICVK